MCVKFKWTTAIKMQIRTQCFQSLLCPSTSNNAHQNLKHLYVASSNLTGTKFLPVVCLSCRVEVSFKSGPAFLLCTKNLSFLCQSNVSSVLHSLPLTEPERICLVKNNSVPFKTQRLLFCNTAIALCPCFHLPLPCFLSVLHSLKMDETVAP